MGVANIVRNAKRSIMLDHQADIDNFGYDGSGRLTESITHDTGGTDTGGQSLDDKTGYDDKGRLQSQSETIKDSSGNTLSAIGNIDTYDPATGQLQQETQGVGVAAQYQYYNAAASTPGEPDALQSLILDQNGTTTGSELHLRRFRPRGDAQSRRPGNLHLHVPSRHQYRGAR